MSKYKDADLSLEIIMDALDGTEYAGRVRESLITIREALTRMAEIEEGKSVVVPVEPTEAIRGAFYNEMRRQGYKTMDVAVIDEMNVYRAMIAAREGK